MALLICGATATGKDTTVKILVDKYKMKKLVTYTTRPMRPGEIDGVTYHYISEEEFHKKKDSDFFAEWTSYRVRVGTGETWYYGSPKDGFENNTVAIVNPDGWRKLCGKGHTIFLTCNPDVQQKRLVARGDNPEEAARRVLSDKKDFRYFDGYSDFTIDTSNLSPSEVAEMIYSFWESKYE